MYINVIRLSIDAWRMWMCVYICHTIFNENRKSNSFVTQIIAQFIHNEKKNHFRFHFEREAMAFCTISGCHSIKNQSKLQLFLCYFSFRSKCRSSRFVCFLVRFFVCLSLFCHFVLFFSVWNFAEKSFPLETKQQHRIRAFSFLFLVIFWCRFDFMHSTQYSNASTRIEQLLDVNAYVATHS